jgi:hypothetical protein
MDSIILTFLSSHLYIYGIWVASFRWNWGVVEEVLLGGLALLRVRSSISELLGEIYKIVTKNAQNLVKNRNKSLKLGLMFTNIIIKIYTCAKNITRGEK